MTVTNTILSETVQGIETFAITNRWWFGGAWLLTPDDAAIQADILIK